VSPNKKVIESGSKVLMTKTLRKEIQFETIIDQKLQITYPEATVKDVQNAGEAFSPQKRICSISKN
jgi:hypothetical protein